MRLVRTRVEKKKLAQILDQHIELSDELIGESLQRFPIDIGSITEIVHQIREKPQDRRLALRKLAECGLITQSTLPPILTSPKAEISPVTPFDIAKIRHIRESYQQLSLLLQDRNLVSFIGHDARHIGWDSFTCLYGYLISDSLTFVRLASDKSLHTFLQEYNYNCQQALPLLNFPGKMVCELSGMTLETKLTPRQMADSVISSLKNRFPSLFYHGGLQVINNIPQEMEFGSHPFCHLSFIYNTMKNALKQAEELLDYSSTKELLELERVCNCGYGVEIGMAKDSDNSEYIVCSQNFKGPDLYLLAGHGAKLAEEKPESFSKNTLRRYKNWTDSPIGKPFGKIHIGDLYEVMFGRGISGAHLHSPTSGLGLYGVKHVLGKSLRAKAFCSYTPDGRTHFAMQLQPAA